VGFVTPSSPSPAQLGTSLPRLGQAGSVIATQTVRSVAETQRSIQVLVCDDAATGECAPPANRLDLQLAIQKTNGVVAIHRALELQREDAVQIAGGAGDKGAAPLRGRDLKATIELGEVAFAEEAIRLLQRTASGQAQLLRQTPLPSCEVAFTAAARLRRVGRDHADTQFPQCPPYLGQLMRIDRLPRLRGQPEVAATIAVQGAEQTLALNHFLERHHHR
jgi:hypothetical protein